MMGTGERGAPSQVSSLEKRRRERYETYICDLTQADSKNSDETETAGPKKRGRQGGSGDETDAPVPSHKDPTSIQQ